MKYRYRSDYISVSFRYVTPSYGTTLAQYILLLTLFLILNYNPQTIISAESLLGWTFSLLCTGWVLVMMRRIEPARWRDDLGLCFKREEVYNALVLFIILLFGVFIALRIITSYNGYRYFPSAFTYFMERRRGNMTLLWSNIIPLYLYHITQTFNEEMISGALLLKKVQKFFPKAADLIIAAAVALVFALAHLVFYRVTPANKGDLAALSLLSLFLAGWIRNVLILHTGHILYAWALHLAWNLLFFPSFFYVKYTRYVVQSETLRINAVLGDWRMVLILLIISACTGLWYRGNHRKHRQEK